MKVMLTLAGKEEGAAFHVEADGDEGEWIKLSVVDGRGPTTSVEVRREEFVSLAGGEML